MPPPTPKVGAAAARLKAAEAEKRGTPTVFLLVDRILGGGLTLPAAELALEQTTALLRAALTYRREGRDAALLRADQQIILLFHGGMEAALDCAAEASDALRGLGWQARFCLHYGKVCLLRNRQENWELAGPGLKDAQTLTNFGEAGHILLSPQAVTALPALSGWRNSIREASGCFVPQQGQKRIFYLHDSQRKLGRSSAPLPAPASLYAPTPVYTPAYEPLSAATRPHYVSSTQSESRPFLMAAFALCLCLCAGFLLSRHLKPVSASTKGYHKPAGTTPYTPDKAVGPDGGGARSEGDKNRQRPVQPPKIAPPADGGISPDSDPQPTATDAAARYLPPNVTATFEGVALPEAPASNEDPLDAPGADPRSVHIEIRIPENSAAPDVIIPETVNADVSDYRRQTDKGEGFPLDGARELAFDVSVDHELFSLTLAYRKFAASTVEFQSRKFIFLMPHDKKQ